MTFKFVTSLRLTALIGSISLLAPSALQAIVVSTTENSQYSLEILQVTYDTQGTQTSSATTTTVSVDPVNLTSITRTTNELVPFYDNEVRAIDWNPANESSSYSVLKNGTATEAADDLAAYGTALSDSFTNTNLLNYSNKDSEATLTAYDYNIIFKYGLDTADYVVIGERDGNSLFRLQALDINGAVIGNDVYFDQAYRWNSGYADSSFTTQPMWINLVDLSAFFHDGATPEDIFGFRVINPGGADIKVLAGSETSFIETDNINPNYPVPEPSTYGLLLGIAIFGSVLARRRIR